MNITDLTTELFCKIDDALPNAAHHSQAILSISEPVTIGVLQAMKHVSQRAFYHWLKDNYGYLFPPPLADPIATFNILVHFNILVQRNGLQPDATGKVRLSITQFTL